MASVSAIKASHSAAVHTLRSTKAPGTPGTSFRVEEVFSAIDVLVLKMTASNDSEVRHTGSAAFVNCSLSNASSTVTNSTSALVYAADRGGSALGARACSELGACQ